METYTLSSFLQRFSSDEKCLRYLFHLRYPSGVWCRGCQRVKPFTKVRGRKVYQCSCGQQVSPLAGTIFAHSPLPLSYWFFAIFALASSKNGVPATYLSRVLGISYPAAWRMLHRIRRVMGGDVGALSGVVEVDETFVGGKGYNRGRLWWANWEERPKAIVLGMVERGGRVKTVQVPNTGVRTLTNEIRRHVAPDALVFSDQNPSYHNLFKYGYTHGSINHSKSFVKGDFHTQTIENFWSHLKRGITGVYRYVSPKYLQHYTDEFAFRYNHRNEAMVDVLLRTIATTPG